MKRRVISTITALALCLSLCPTWALAADLEPDVGLCPHHRVHTEECGYVPPAPGRDCAHEHDENCFITETLCVHQHTEDCYPEPVPDSDPDSQPESFLCTHKCGEDSGCVTLTLNCTHIHDEACGYVSESSGAPCGFACRVCPIEAMLDELPRSVTLDNKGQVEEQFSAILALYAELSAEERDQLDLSRCLELQAQLDAANAPMLASNGVYYFKMKEDYTVTRPYCVTDQTVFDTCGYSFTASKSAAIEVESTGVLSLMGYVVRSERGAGVEVLSGGSLTVGDPGLTVSGTTYGLNIASGATVKLSGGTFTGGTAAIQTADNDFEALLENGYGYFDAAGNPIPAAAVAAAKTVVVKIAQKEPVIKWNVPSYSVNYNGNPVDGGDLLSMITIDIDGTSEESLKSYIQYSYRKVNAADFIDGLPTNAGSYEIKASFPEQETYKAAETNPCLQLTINKIAAVIAAPEAAQPFYNGGAQALVTAGVVENGAVIEFAQAEKGPYSADIPVEINAGSYQVWYRVAETENYTGVSAAEIPNVQIQRKPITPAVELSDYTYLYDGGWKQPKVTVKDGETELPNSEYEVNYVNNQNVGTATVKVTDRPGGNYAVAAVDVDFKITLLAQAALSISDKPNTVTYGERFTLSTSGGSGNGEVTWKITSGGNVAEVDPNSGQVTIKGCGTAAVQATKSGTYNGVKNYEDAVAVWTFTADKKPVVATVSAKNKTYNGDAAATVEAVVEQGVLAGDEITITGLTGSFSDENAGTGKTVTVNTSNALISGYHSEYYIVTYSSAASAVKADITKKETSISTAPGPKTLTYNGAGQELVTGGAADTGISLEYALSEAGPYSTAIPEAVAAGKYEVWYRVPETDNYTGTAAKKVDAAIGKKSIASPQVTLDKTDYIYDGNAKEPGVTVKEPGGSVISSSEYTVAYSNHIKVGTATVTVTAKADGNYDFSQTAQFNIKKAKAVLTSTPQAKELTYTGKSQDLVTVGTATGGKVVYSLSETADYLETIPQGMNAGTYTIYYKVKGDDNHADTAASPVSVTIKQKEIISPVITLAGNSFPYTGHAQEPAVVKVEDGGNPILANEYTVAYRDNIDAGTATVHIVNANGSNYIVNGSAAFEITKVQAAFTTEPKGKESLAYDGTAQALVTAGSSQDGTVVYSLDGGPYSTAIPTGIAPGSYAVSAKVQGDKNHTDSGDKTITVSIGVNTVKNPTIELSSSSFRYNGSEQKPTIKVLDDKGNEIPAKEYTVTYSGDTVDAGTYAVVVTGKGTNYSFTASTSFKILAADQAALTITGKPNVVYYGDTIQLGATGGTGDGTVTWTIEDGMDNAVHAGSGLFEIKGVGRIVIKAARKDADGNYADVEDEWEFFAHQKPVTAVVTAKNKKYDGLTTVELTVTVPGTTIRIEGVTGAFDNENVGIEKTVLIDHDNPTVTNGDNYQITYPDTTTASIYKVDAKLQTKPAAASGLVYDGSEQALLTAGGDTEKNIGVIEYSLREKGEYSTAFPTAVGAGTYTVWYKVAGSVNYTGIDPASIEVKIDKAPTSVKTEPVVSGVLTKGQALNRLALSGGEGQRSDGATVPGSFAWEDGGIVPEGTAEQRVTFTPTDTTNYESCTTTVEVTVTEAPSGGDGAGEGTTGGDTTGGDGAGEGTTGGGTTGGDTTGGDGAGEGTTGGGSAGGSGTNTGGVSAPSAVSAPMQTGVQNGTAKTVVSAAGADKLVREAVANQSEAVVIKPQINVGVTKTEVSIPASMVSRIQSETSANLTVSTPVAEVTIPNAALNTLSSAGGIVSVVTEQAENAVALTLSAGGRSVDSIPGGLTLTVPVEDAGPGTVAVLVRDDGTRETIRKAVPEDGELSILLNGSARVEIVDNRKEFADVSASDWEADAVAFASAHELFNGTSETRFSPNQSMSRAMLATVLYNLEGRPAQSLTDEFSDVDSGAWYAAGVSWAAENGITNGYDNGKFGSDDGVTREQFAVMLWRYAGSPAANSGALSFVDADQASDYAVEALRWAAANGILNGHDDGRLDSGGLTTRAQAAQILKNFMENT